MGHIVKATLIVAKVDSTERYFEKGATLPSGVSTEERKRLVSIGVVEYVKDAPKTTEDDGTKTPADPNEQKPDPKKPEPAK